MEVVVLDDADQLGELAADAVVQLLHRMPTAVLGLATGSSPLPVYRALERRHDDGWLSLARARAFTLDEYVGLPPGHPASYREVIRAELSDRLDLPDAAVHAPDGAAPDVEQACRDYDAAIEQAGGVDLQLLGIGTDGHIAFNEPGSSLASRTRIKTLTEQTRSDNARFFDGDRESVPQHCLTQGLGTIMRARHQVLLATGEGKARAVRELVEGPVSARWPATVLQWHPHVTVLLDPHAAGELELLDYYRYAWAHKPDWQGL